MRSRQARRVRSIGIGEDVTVRVKCEGQYHKITLRPGGQIVWHSHTKQEIRAEKTVAALAGSVCGCLAFVEALREGKAGSAKLQETARLAKLKRSIRMKERSASEQPLGRVNRVFALAESYYGRMVTAALPRGPRVEVAVRAVFTFGQFSPGSRRRQETITPRHCRLNAFLFLPVDWFEAVARNGCAFVDGALVLSLSDTERGGWRLATALWATASKPERAGCDLCALSRCTQEHPWQLNVEGGRILVRRTADGRWEAAGRVSEEDKSNHG